MRQTGMQQEKKDMKKKRGEKEGWENWKKSEAGRDKGRELETKWRRV